MVKLCCLVRKTYTSNWDQSDLGPYCLKYIGYLRTLANEIADDKRQQMTRDNETARDKRQQTTRVITGGKTSANYNLQQTTIANFAAFSKITNKA